MQMVCVKPSISNTIGIAILLNIHHQMFDNPATRPQLQALYNAEQSLLSFEGQQMQVNNSISSICYLMILNLKQCYGGKKIKIQLAVTLL